MAGFNILSSNNISQGDVTAPTGEQGWTFNGSDQQLSSVDMSNTKMLAFQKSAIGVVKLKELSMQMSGSDYNLLYAATMMQARRLWRWSSAS